MRSMVERDTLRSDGNAPSSPSFRPLQVFSVRTSRSTTLRVVPLSQEGEA
jgi:hypothetical protein